MGQQSSARRGSGTGDDQPLGGVADQLADWVDELLVRLEALRRHPGVPISVAAFTLGLAGFGWWSARFSPQPVEASLPFAPLAIESSSPVGEPTLDAPAPVPGSGVTTVVAADVAEADVAEADVVEADVDEADVADLVVHVIGEVGSPGLVTVVEGARVADVIEAAGGPTTEADIHRLNLAAKVADGSQVIVPAVDSADEGPFVVADPLSSRGAGADGSGRINLNSATSAQLQSLPGVGPATAAAIEAWRDEHGPFVSAEELDEVPGIGPAKLAALIDLVEV